MASEVSEAASEVIEVASQISEAASQVREVASQVREVASEVIEVASEVIEVASQVMEGALEVIAVIWAVSKGATVHFSGECSLNCVNTNSEYLCKWKRNLILNSTRAKQ